MPIWRLVWARLHGLLRRDATAGEIREELEFHLRMRTEEYERRGLLPAAAARHAVARVGNLAVLQDRGYDVRGGGLVETVWQDIRYALRLLGHHRGFALVAILTLALGIGLSTALATVIDATRLHPLPYPHPEALVGITVQAPQNNGRMGRMGPSVEETETFAGASHLVSQFAVSRGLFPDLVVDGPVPERLATWEITNGFFGLYGVHLVLGRDLTADDLRDGASPVVLLGYDYWLRAFEGRASALGQLIHLDDGVYTVVGIVPRAFHHDVALWRPLQLTPFVFTKEGLGTSTQARLNPGVSLADAEHELSNILARRADHAAGASIHLSSLLQDEAGQSPKTTAILAETVSLILLIACVNVAGLLLARGTTRLPELAVRAAIGAGRARLVRQLLTESVVLATAGGLAGVLLAWWSLDAIVANLPIRFATDAPPTLNWRVLGFAAALAVVTGLVFGLIPAIRLSKDGLAGVLAHGSRRAGSSLSRRGGQLLIAAETALALVLLAGAGLMLRSYSRVLAVDLGFRPESFLTLESAPVGSDAATFATYYRNLVDLVRRAPGVSAAGAIDHLPLKGSSRMGIVSSPAVPKTSAGMSNLRQVLPGYFEALGLRPTAGRVPTEADLTAHRKLAVLNQTAAHAFFPDGPAIGRSVTIGDAPTEVIGVVPDIRFAGPLSTNGFGSRNEVFQLYAPTGLDKPAPLIVVIRPTGASRLIGESLRAAVEQAGPHAYLGRVRAGTDWFDDTIVTPRRQTVLLVLLGALGLVLTVVGIVGMTSYAVARRTQEIGVRMAFGARAGTVVRLMLVEAALPVAAGLALGLVGAVLSTRLIAAFLFETTPTDPLTLSVVVATLALTAVVAAWVPARRAARVDPVEALRAD